MLYKSFSQKIFPLRGIFSGVLQTELYILVAFATLRNKKCRVLSQQTAINYTFLNIKNYGRGAMSAIFIISIYMRPRKIGETNFASCFPSGVPPKNSSAILSAP